MGRTMPVGLRGDRPLLQRWKTANRWRNRSHVTIRLRTLPGNKIKRISLGGDAKPIRRPLLFKGRRSGPGQPAREEANHEQISSGSSRGSALHVMPPCLDLPMRRA